MDFRRWIAATLVFAIASLAVSVFSYASMIGGLREIRAKEASIGHLHSDVRINIIRSQMARVDRPVVIYGDSIVEMAMLPPQLCGRPAVNAGIGGATTKALAQYAAYIFSEFDPALIVISAGVNDILSAPSALEVSTFKDRYLDLVGKLKTPVITATLTPLSNFDVSPYNGAIKDSGRASIHLKSDGNTTDGVHLTPEGYLIWTKALVDQIEPACAILTQSAKQ